MTPTVAAPLTTHDLGASAVIDRLKSLRAIAAVALHGSTIAAAEALHLSQPAITRAVLDLERSFELRLFERASRGMLPTEVGARVAQRSRVLLEHLAKGVQEAAVFAPEGKPWRGGPERFAHTVPPASLRAFVAVASATSEVKAARALAVSQPAVHRSLRAMEHLSGLALFQTSARGTRLTEAGDALLRRIKLAFAEARAIEGEIAAWRGRVSGRIVIGALPLSVGLLVPAAVDAVVRRHPEVEVRIVDGVYESLVRQLRSAEVDVIVGALRPTPASPDLTQRFFFEDDLAVVARVGHPVLSRRRLRLQHLLDYDWVVPLAGTPARAALDLAFARAGLAGPATRVEAGSPAMTRALVIESGRLALASLGQALRDEQTDRVRIVPVRLPGTTRSIGATLRSEGEPSPDLRILLDELAAAAEGLQGHKQIE